MTASDTLVYNERFSLLTNLVERIQAKHTAFAADGDIFDALTLKGQHNRENARAVLTVCDLLGISREIVREAFVSFVALPHRLQEIATVDGVLYVNDSISTTPQSAIAAIDVYANNLGVIILGGQDRGYDFTPLAKRLKEIPSVLALVMPGGDNVFQSLEDFGVASERVADLDEAVAKTRAHMSSGVCLMSPASPSYGQFKNFEERGEKFAEAVKKFL